MTEAQDQALPSMFADYSKKICDAIHGCRSRLSLPIQITPHSFQNPESQFQNVQETDGIVDYHEKFLSICSRGTFSEAYLVDVYLAGLQLEMQTKVRMLKPQTIRQCLLFGKLYEYAYPRLPRKLNGNHRPLKSSKKDVLVPLQSSAMVCNGAPAPPAYQLFDEMLEPIDDSEMLLHSPELLTTMTASSEISGNCTDLVSRSMEDAANHKKGVSDVIALRSQDSRDAFHELEQDLKTQPDINCAGVETESIAFSLNWGASQAAFGVPQRNEFPVPAQEDISRVSIEHLPPTSVATVEVFEVLQQDEIPILVQGESSKFPLSKGLLGADEIISTFSNLDDIPPDWTVTPYFLIASADMSQSCVQLVEIAKEAMESLIVCVEPVRSSSDFLEFHSAHYMFDEMPSIEFQLFLCSCPLKDDQMSGYGHSALFGDPLRFVFDPGKQMTNWICAHKSTVSFIHGAWLSILGVSIWPVDSSSFVWDPGVADSYFCPGLSVHILEFYGTGCSCVACWIFIGEG